MKDTLLHFLFYSTAEAIIFVQDTGVSILVYHEEYPLQRRQ